MTNHSTDLRDKFLALIERMEKTEDENARLRAELDAARKQEPVAYRSIEKTPGRHGETHSNYCTIPWPQREIVHPLFASPVPAQQQEPIAYLSWEKSGDLDYTKYKPIRAGTEIFTHRVNSDSWEVLPVYASNITAQQLTDAEIENLRIKADAYDIACDDLERFQQSRVAAGKAPGTEGSLCDGMAWAYSRIDELESAQKQGRIESMGLNSRSHTTNRKNTGK